MPLERPDQRGTNASGAKVDDYCAFCYKDGHFTEPNLTKREMITRAVGFLVTTQKMPEHAAQAVAHHVVPTLKRWLNGAG
jgi:hypothetical protein